MRTKAIYVLALALCAGVVSGCVDEDLDGGKEVSGKAIKFGLSSQKTKTVYDDADPYQINWVDGDQIKIFCAEAESAKSALYNVTPARAAKDGTIANPKIVQSVSAELDREALRVVRAMPAWKPGEDRGKPCRTLFCLPIVFKLS